jgi:hypothetical protein
MNYTKNLDYATDCYVEVDYQVNTMNGWLDNLRLEGLEYDLNAENAEEVAEDLNERVGIYDDFISVVQTLLEAAQEVQRGLDRAREAAESYEDGEAA